ncbi:MAG: DNA replication and repair protein RecF [Halobacteriovoraceae bacterium]|nr:DNA replication and repair protein RecF [Halobacteriovoraceae bacterium]
MSFRLSKLKTINFRNLSSDIIHFSPHINCITGDNGHGKTNILEAVYLLANRKSFRKNAGFPQYVGLDSEKMEIEISSVLSDGAREFSYSGRILPHEVGWWMDSRKIYREYPLKVILINPFDSNSFHTQKGFRRDWFDHHIGLIDPEYKKVLSRYNKALKFKNSLLFTSPPHIEPQLSIIDRELSSSMEQIADARSRFITQINGCFENIFHQIFSREHRLEIILNSPFYGKNKEEITEILLKNRQKDKIKGISTCGVHRDDYLLFFDGFNSFEYCSLGQQKTAFLGLLFAYVQLFRYTYSTFPIVLIDDISGELDVMRWKRLVQFLKNGSFQVLITTANENFKEELKVIDNVAQINVKRGMIIQ